MSSYLILSLISLICVEFVELASVSGNQEIGSETILIRNLRNAEGTHEECCGKGKTQFTEEEKKNFEECKQQYQGKYGGDTPSRADVIRTMECVTYCVAKKNNLLDDNGYVKEESFASDMVQIYPEDSVKKIAVANAHNCTLEGNNFAKDNWEQVKTQFCNPASYMAAHCLMNAVDMDCPKEVQNQSDTCQKRRQHLQNMKQNY
uniref:Chemosensory protein n=1 Tax=Blattella germanica TaxID=6973 RepID=A0A0X8DCA6_BLAGE|nr:chemosensory protein [Blattella germanica]